MNDLPLTTLQFDILSACREGNLFALIQHLHSSLGEDIRFSVFKQQSRSPKHTLFDDHLSKHYNKIDSLLDDYHHNQLLSFIETPDKVRNYIQLISHQNCEHSGFVTLKVHHPLLTSLINNWPGDYNPLFVSARDSCNVNFIKFLIVNGAQMENNVQMSNVLVELLRQISQLDQIEQMSILYSSEHISDQTPPCFLNFALKFRKKSIFNTFRLLYKPKIIDITTDWILKCVLHSNHTDLLWLIFNDHLSENKQELLTLILSPSAFGTFTYMNLIQYTVSENLINTLLVLCDLLNEFPSTFRDIPESVFQIYNIPLQSIIKTTQSIILTDQIHIISFFFKSILRNATFPSFAPLSFAILKGKPNAIRYLSQIGYEPHISIPQTLYTSPPPHIPLRWFTDLSALAAPDSSPKLFCFLLNKWGNKPPHCNMSCFDDYTSQNPKSFPLFINTNQQVGLHPIINAINVNRTSFSAHLHQDNNNQYHKTPHYASSRLVIPLSAPKSCSQVLIPLLIAISHLNYPLVCFFARHLYRYRSSYRNGRFIRFSIILHLLDLLDLIQDVHHASSHPKNSIVNVVNNDTLSALDKLYSKIYGSSRITMSFAPQRTIHEQLSHCHSPVNSTPCPNAVSKMINISSHLYFPHFGRIGVFSAIHNAVEKLDEAQLIAIFNTHRHTSFLFSCPNQLKSLQDSFFKAAIHTAQASFHHSTSLQDTSLLDSYHNDIRLANVFELILEQFTQHFALQHVIVSKFRSKQKLMCMEP